MRVERVQQPEAADIGDGEVGEPLVALAPAAGEGAALGREPLDEAAGEREQRRTGRDVEQRRYEGRIERQLARRGACNARDRQRRDAFGALPLENQPQARRGDLDRSLGEAGGLVAHQLFVGLPPGPVALAAARHVAGAGPVLRHGEVHAQRALVGGEGIGEQARCRRRTARWHVEEQAVGKASRGAGEHERAAGERLVVEGEARDAPRTERERAHLEGERLVVVAVLRLQMLRREEHTLGPEDRLQARHGGNVRAGRREATRGCNTRASPTFQPVA